MSSRTATPPCGTRPNVGAGPRWHGSSAAPARRLPVSCRSTFRMCRRVATWEMQAAGSPSPWRRPGRCTPPRPGRLRPWARSKAGCVAARCAGWKVSRPKSGGALDRLPEGGRLVYPTSNDPEIPARLRERLDERNMEATAIASVDEALDRLFPAIEADSPTAADVAVPQRRSVPGSSDAGAEEPGVEPPLGTPWPATGSRLATRWLIAVGVAAATAAAIWLGREGQHPPPPSAGANCKHV